MERMICGRRDGGVGHGGGAQSEDVVNGVGAGSSGSHSPNAKTHAAAHA